MPYRTRVFRVIWGGWTESLRGKSFSSREVFDKLLIEAGAEDENKLLHVILESFLTYCASEDVKLGYEERFSNWLEDFCKWRPSKPSFESLDSILEDIEGREESKGSRHF